MKIMSTEVEMAKPKLTVIMPSTILVNWEACENCRYKMFWGENLSEYKQEMQERAVSNNQLFEEFSDLKPGSHYKFCMLAET